MKILPLRKCEFLIHNFLMNSKKISKMICVEERYWEQRYFTGGTSGPGSVGVEKAWKWCLIDQFVPVLDQVLDVGCGDLSFWEGRNCVDYVGIDISKTVIEKNLMKRPTWQFINANADKRLDGLKKDVVFCLDLLFHIMDTKTFLKILMNLCYYSTNYICIHTWKYNPFDMKNQIKQLPHYLLNLKPIKAINALNKLLGTSKKITDAKYQYFRPLESYLNIFKKYGFNLLITEENPNKIGALYIFRKKQRVKDL